MIEMVVIIAVSLTYNISLRRAVMYLVNEVIWLSFAIPVGDMENSIMGLTGYSPAKSVMW